MNRKHLAYHRRSNHCFTYWHFLVFWSPKKETASLTATVIKWPVRNPCIFNRAAWNLRTLTIF
jgi:hypothetical protein